MRNIGNDIEYQWQNNDGTLLELEAVLLRGIYKIHSNLEFEQQPLI